MQLLLQSIIINFVFHSSLCWLVAMQIKSSWLPVWSAGKLEMHLAVLLFLWHIEFSVQSQRRWSKCRSFRQKNVLNKDAGISGKILSQVLEDILSFQRPKSDKIRISTRHVCVHLISLSGSSLF